MFCMSIQLRQGDLGAKLASLLVVARIIVREMEAARSVRARPRRVVGAWEIDLG